MSRLTAFINSKVDNGDSLIVMLEMQVLMRSANYASTILPPKRFVERPVFPVGTGTIMVQVRMRPAGS